MADDGDIPNSPGGPAPADAATARRSRLSAGWKRLAFALPVAAAIAVVAALAGIKARWWRAPYPAAGKAVCWRLGMPEEAYNFDEVTPGRIYRSGRPDERFYRYVHRRYGVRRVIRLNGADRAVPLPPEELAMTLMTLTWSNDSLPPPDELATVLTAMDGPEPVLVHCWAGADRTGYAVAAYRIDRQKWPVERALREMDRYGHDPKRKPAFQRSLRALAASE